MSSQQGQLNAPATLTSTDRDAVPSREDFQRVFAARFARTAVRRDKGLVSPASYNSVLWLLLQDSGQYELSRAFSKDESQGERNRKSWQGWARHSYRLAREGERILPGLSLPAGYNIYNRRDNKPVISPATLFEALVFAHRASGHGGRDRTHASFRNYFQACPKDVVASFCLLCPTCVSRRTTKGTEEKFQEVESQPSIPIPDSSDPAPSYPSVSLQPPSPSQASGLVSQLSGATAAVCEVDRWPSQHARSQEMRRDTSSSRSALSTNTDSSGPLTPDLGSDAHQFSLGEWVGQWSQQMNDGTGKFAADPMSKDPMQQMEVEINAIQGLLHRGSCGTVPDFLPQVTQAHDPFEAQHAIGNAPGPTGLEALPTSSGFLKRGNRPPPLCFPVQGQNHSQDSKLTGPLLSVTSNTSAYSAVSEPAVQRGLAFQGDEMLCPQNGFVQPGFDLHQYPATAPAHKASFSQDEIASLQDQRAFESLMAAVNRDGHSSSRRSNLGARESPCEATVATPLSAVPQTTTANFGPSYGAVFGNVAGGAGNLNFSAEHMPRTLYGAPDLAVYLSPQYGIPGMSSNPQFLPMVAPPTKPIEQPLDHPACLTKDRPELTRPSENLRRHSITAVQATGGASCLNPFLSRANHPFQGQAAPAASLAQLQDWIDKIPSSAYRDQDSCSIYSDALSGPEPSSSVKSPNHGQSYSNEHFRDRARHDTDGALSTSTSGHTLCFDESQTEYGTQDGSYASWSDHEETFASPAGNISSLTVGVATTNPAIVSLSPSSSHLDLSQLNFSGTIAGAMLDGDESFSSSSTGTQKSIAGFRPSMAESTTAISLGEISSRTNVKEPHAETGSYFVKACESLNAITSPRLPSGSRKSASRSASSSSTASSSSVSTTRSISGAAISALSSSFEALVNDYLRKQS
ncbi:hypothetical protein IE53DRAFT_360104 [Violaceomyces palustris]|uniref:Uncharacterized protein n=1 Tax=Violaceomyces palustris TaxID=1673888 RepID=A0ACD0P5R6_9BASI|nr:hypothetical protein IE53DRAFT_360104 [Violaceomyces palustris]